MSDKEKMETEKARKRSFSYFFCNCTNIRTKANTHRHTWSHLRIFGPEWVMYEEM